MKRQGEAVETRCEMAYHQQEGDRDLSQNHQQQDDLWRPLIEPRSEVIRATMLGDIPYLLHG